MNTSSLIGHVLQLLEHIDGENQPADRLTGDFFRSKKYLGQRDRRFISDTVYGMIRHRRLIKALLREFILENPGNVVLEGPHVRYLAQYAVFAITAENKSIVPPLLWKTHFPRIDPGHFAGWMEKNLSLDFVKDNEITRLAIRYSFQDWMVKDLNDALGEETERLLSALNTPAPTVLRVNTFKASREECQTRLRAEGIETEKTNYSPCGLKASKRFNMQSLKTFQDGFFEMQDEGSQIISMLAGLKPGDTVIDACAGAGGKSLHMSALMQNKGEIIAVDITGSRLYELGKRAQRAGVNIIKTIQQNKLLPENFRSKADLVLVDAPCSGVGTIRRNPGLKWSITESLVQHYAEKQKQILEFNSGFVKPGGKLVYATCSLLKQENEMVVKSFLDSHDNFHLTLPSVQLDSLGIKIDQPLITLYPNRFDTDGFFIAVMRRD